MRELARLLCALGVGAALLPAVARPQTQMQIQRQTQQQAQPRIQPQIQPQPQTQPAALSPEPRITFSFSNPGLTPSTWRLEFDATGVGTYHSEGGIGESTIPFDRSIRVSGPLRAEFFSYARSHTFFSFPCQRPRDKTAFTGQKTLSYAGSDGNGSCTFNWSPDGRLMKIAGSFLGISLTIEEGRRLHLAYLHDRLGLDSELETLCEAVKNGTALEIENIAPQLQEIADDPAIMRRAQARAAALLSGAGLGAGLGMDTTATTR